MPPNRRNAAETTPCTVSGEIVRQGPRCAGFFRIRSLGIGALGSRLVLRPHLHRAVRNLGEFLLPVADALDQAHSTLRCLAPRIVSHDVRPRYKAARCPALNPEEPKKIAVLASRAARYIYDGLQDSNINEGSIIP